VTERADKEESERLRKEQAERVELESELAEESATPEERRTHERRADKAEYLREKLRERSESD
jgi:hypothetical protein